MRRLPLRGVVPPLRGTKLAEFRREFEALIGEYFGDNLVRQDYLLTRATKI